MFKWILLLALCRAENQLVLQLFVDKRCSPIAELRACEGPDVTWPLYIYNYLVVLIAQIPLTLLPIIHCSWQVVLTISSVQTELMNVSLCWLSSFGVSMCGSPHESLTYEFDPDFTAVSSMSCSSYSDVLWDRKQVTVQQLFCGVLLSGCIQNSM